MSTYQQLKRAGNIKLHHKYDEGSITDFSGNGNSGLRQNGYLILPSGGYIYKSNQGVLVNALSSLSFDFSWMDTGDMSAITVESCPQENSITTAYKVYLNIITDKSSNALVWTGRRVLDKVDVYATDGMVVSSSNENSLIEPNGYCCRGFSWDRNGSLQHFLGTTYTISAGDYTTVSSIGTPSGLRINNGQGSYANFGLCKQFLLFDKAITFAEFTGLRTELLK